MNEIPENFGELPWSLQEPYRSDIANLLAKNIYGDKLKHSEEVAFSYSKKMLEAMNDIGIPIELAAYQAFNFATSAMVLYMMENKIDDAEIRQLLLVVIDREVKDSREYLQKKADQEGAKNEQS